MKKFLALLISLSMLLMCVPGISLVASAAVPTQDGDVYLISSAAEFESVFGVNGENASLLTGGKEFRQTADFKLSATYAPSATKFDGIYDGNGKTIEFQTGSSSDLKTFSATTGYGLFINPTGTIKNVTTAGYIYCGKETYVAAIAGGSGTTADIINCVNNAYVSQSGATTGGIVARPASSAEITNCINKGEIAGNSNVGGIAGWSTSSILSECINTGFVHGSSNAAGILGTVTAATITDCVNLGNVTGSTYAAGILGLTGGKGTATLEKCYNTGEINAKTVAAMFAAVGTANYQTVATITDCYNSGLISGGATNKGSAAALVYTNTAAPSSATVTNYYDAANPALSIAGTVQTGATVTATNAYILNATGTPTYGENITEANLIANPFSSDDWEVKEGYAYPQLKSNPHVYLSDFQWIKGLGTEADPYKIDTEEKFRAVFGADGAYSAYLASGTYLKQTADIEFTSPYTSRGAQSRDTDAGVFHGVYDGGNYSITINSSANNTAVGTDSLIGSVGSNGVVKNLTVEGSKSGITLNQNAPLVGVLLSTGKISNCVNRADISSTTGQLIGGVVGYQNSVNSIVENCYNYGDVTASTNQIGGVVGGVNGGKVINCGNMGTVTATGKKQVGGITGRAFGRINTNGSNYNFVENCYNAGNVIGGSQTGGIVGFGAYDAKNTVDLTIKNCYNTGVVTGTATTGSIIGQTTATPTAGAYKYVIESCYDIANSSLQLVGSTPADSSFITTTITNCYALGSTITVDELKVVPTGFDTNVWKNGSTVEGEYPYAELKNNPYYGVIPEPPVEAPIKGEGTKASPYLIEDVDDFVLVFGNGADNEFADYRTDAYYKQENDIVLPADFVPATGVATGSTYTIDNVNYDGNNKSITWQSGTEEAPISPAMVGTVNSFGLWARATALTVTDLTTKGTIYITGSSHINVGAFGGYSAKVNITNCVNDTDITATAGNTVGGFFGRTNGSFTGCENSGNISIEGDNVGGFIGWGSASLTECVNSGDIKGGAGPAGGFYGAFNGTFTISKCANLGAVSNGGNAAGFLGSVGNITEPTITESYNAGPISGHTVGGLVGNFYHNGGNNGAAYTTDATITDCYNTGILSTTKVDSMGSAVGRAAVGISNADNICSVTLNVANFFDIANPLAPVVNEYDHEGRSVDFTGSNLYVLNAGKDFGEKGANVTVDGLKDATLFGNANWTAVNGELFPYIQLANNAYAGVKVNEAAPIGVAANTDIFLSTDIAEGDPDLAAYGNFAIVASKFNKAASLTGDFTYGVVISKVFKTADTLTAENNAVLAKADVNFNGAYGMLIYGKNMVPGDTYYVRPYVKYNDEYIYGAVQSFVLPGAPEAE